MATKTRSGLTFSCEASELAAVLKRVMPAIGTRSSVDILSCVLISSERGVVTLTTNSMEMAMSSSLRAEGVKKGQLAVKASKLNDILKKATGTIAVSVEKGKAKLKVGRATFSLDAYPVEDFPAMPELGRFDFWMEVRLFREAWATVETTYSRDQSRPVLCGVGLERSKGELVVAATDSYRLGVDSLEVEDESVAESGVSIVPGAMLQKVLRLATNLRSTVVNVHGQNSVNRHLGLVLDPGMDDSTTVSIRKIEGQFPDWRKLLPDNFEITVTFNRLEAIEAVERIADLSTKNAPVRFYIEKKRPLRLGVMTDEVTVEDEIDCRVTGRTDGEMVCGFNAAFMVDALKSLPDTEVQLKVINPLRPALLASDDRPNAGVLVMPIRLAG